MLPFLSEMISDSKWRATIWICDTKPNAPLKIMKYAFAWKSMAWWRKTKNSFGKKWAAQVHAVFSNEAVTKGISPFQRTCHPLGNTRSIWQFRSFFVELPVQDRSLKVFQGLPMVALRFTRHFHISSVMVHTPAWTKAPKVSSMHVIPHLTNEFTT